MTDLEMTKQCALAMGYRTKTDARSVAGVRCRDKGKNVTWNPLQDDAQAMALVKRFKLSLNPHEKTDWCEAVWFGPNDDELRVEVEGVNRAIVECVAKLKKSGKV